MVAQLVQTTTPPDEKDHWRTPPGLFTDLSARYGPFTLDVAADARNHLCDHWYGPGGLAEDALAVSWRHPDGTVRAWCNPPYSRGMIDRFMRKAAAEARLGHARTTFLVPACTDLPWWHDLVWDNERHRFRPGVEVEFFRRRVRFLRPDGRPAGSPNFPSVAVTFGGW